MVTPTGVISDGMPPGVPGVRGIVVPGDGSEGALPGAPVGRGEYGGYWREYAPSPAAGRSERGGAVLASMGAAIGVVAVEEPRIGVCACRDRCA